MGRHFHITPTKVTMASSLSLTSTVRTHNTQTIKVLFLSYTTGRCWIRCQSTDSHWLIGPWCLEGGRGLSIVLLEEVDEPVGGAVVRVHLRCVLQLRFDLLRQLLSQLDPGRREVPSTAASEIALFSPPHTEGLYKKQASRLLWKMNFCTEFKLTPTGHNC